MTIFKECHGFSEWSMSVQMTGQSNFEYILIVVDNIIDGIREFVTSL